MAPSLTGSEADRLLRIKRSQPAFTEWSQERDPDGVAWQYKDDRFIPQMG